MRFDIRLAAAVLSIVGISPHNAGKATATPTAPWCLSVSDSEAIQFQQRLIRLGTSTDPAEGRVRTSLGVPPVAASNITLISDDSICQRISSVRDSIYASDSTVAKGQSLYVARYDSYYAGYVPGDYAGEWRVIEFYDTTTYVPRDAVLYW